MVLSIETKEILHEVRDNYLLLSIINTLQPVKKEAILAGISRTATREALSRAAERLLEGGELIRLRDGRLFVSNTGRKMFGRGPLSRERDVERMSHLIRSTKEG